MLQSKAAQRRRQIAARMREPGALPEAVAIEFGVHAALVYRSCREHKVPLACRSSQKQKRAAIKAMLQQGKCIDEIVELLSCSRKLVYRVASGSGLGLKVPRMGLLKTMIVLRELMLDGKSMDEIGRLVGHSEKTVHRIYQAAMSAKVPGMERKRQGERYSR